jgi:hypothetical protein
MLSRVGKRNKNAERKENRFLVECKRRTCFEIVGWAVKRVKISFLFRNDEMW